MQCEHVLEVLHHCGLCLSDKWWFSHRHHVATHAASYISPGLTPAGCLTPDKLLALPDCRRPAGHPSKKRKDHSCWNKTDGCNQCAACGALGHTHRSCGSPTTECRFNRFWGAAVKWAEEASEIDCEEAARPDLHEQMLLERK